GSWCRRLLVRPLASRGRDGVEGGAVRGDPVDSQRNQMSIRALADKYGVHRRTVREAIDSPIPPPRRTSPRPVPVLDAVRELIDAMLVADRAAPRKQRHTA